MKLVLIKLNLLRGRQKICCHDNKFSGDHEADLILSKPTSCPSLVETFYMLQDFVVGNFVVLENLQKFRRYKFRRIY